MKVIIAGSRSCKDYDTVEKAIKEGLEELKIKPSMILSGGAQGVDKCGEEYAKKHNITLKRYTAKWKDIEGKDPKFIGENQYGQYYKKAGLERNELMADNADALIAISLGTSGTEHMINTAKEKGLLVFEYQPEKQEQCYGFKF